VPGAGEETVPHRPYFEVLVVSPARPAAWSELGQELRKLRRPQDKFIYEPVFVGSCEDAVLATILNGSLEAVMIYEGIPFASSHHSPVCVSSASHLAPAGLTRIRAVRPSACTGIEAASSELDIYFLSDREVEKVAGDTSAACVRRVFYQVEEPLELHLSILDGIGDR